MLLHVLAATLATPSDHWALLVAGSKGYFNYRHTSDVCHAYHTLRAKGIPASNIVTMLYDDVARSPENPYPNQIFNAPTEKGTPGEDVYAGCAIDWWGQTVTPANFVRVLMGDTSEPVEEAPAGNQTCYLQEASVTGPSSPVASCAPTDTCCCSKTSGAFHDVCDAWSCCTPGHICDGQAGCVAGSPPPPPTKRVLRSTITSKVFVNFVDHGAVGLIAFPAADQAHSDGSLHATELMSVLQKMHDKGKYKELVFYLEACESGSMFQDLPSGINVYATTAANAKESSWGTYCAPDDVVDGKTIGSCLGDLYSTKWMEDSDLDTAGETLEDQFKKVQQETNKSHVMEFGDTSIAAEPLVNFQGGSSPAPAARPRVATPSRAGSAASHLDSRSIELTHALERFMRTDDAEHAGELIRLVRERADAAKRFKAISAAVAGADVAGRELPSKVDMACHLAAHKAYVASCGGWTTGALKHSATLAKLCAHTSGEAAPIVAAISATCARK